MGTPAWSTIESRLFCSSAVLHIKGRVYPGGEKQLLNLTGRAENDMT